MSETAKPKARKRAEPADLAGAPARKPRVSRKAAEPEAETVSPETPKAKPARKRASAPARTDIRTQAIAAFQEAHGTKAALLRIEKIRSRQEIRVTARIDGAQRQMRWSYADGTLSPVAA